MTVDRVGGCRESVDGWHGSADSVGRCPWCRLKYTGSAPRPHSGIPLRELSADAAYARMYDPDWTGPDPT